MTRHIKETKTPRSNKTDKVEIRCSHDSRINFKRMSAEFTDYEEFISWVYENFEYFKQIRPPVTGRMKRKAGIL